MKKLLSVFFVMLSLTPLVCLQAQTGEQRSISNLWKGVGGKNKWNTTDFILFSASGNDAPYLLNGRKFLINKKSGECRFEGRTNDGQTLVVLFNYKTEKLLRYFNNGKEVAKSSAEATTSFEKINQQFVSDASLLFLPTMINQADTKVGRVSAKIVNAEKLYTFSFQLKSNSLSGEVLFNAETGLIKQLLDNDGNEYYVNGYKDVGGGLVLPTTFKNLQQNNKSTLFTTVAAFTDMEVEKFETL